MRSRIGIWMFALAVLGTSAAQAAPHGPGITGGGNICVSGPHPYNLTELSDVDLGGWAGAPDEPGVRIPAPSEGAIQTWTLEEAVVNALEPAERERLGARVDWILQRARAAAERSRPGVEPLGAHFFRSFREIVFKLPMISFEGAIATPIRDAWLGGETCARAEARASIRFVGGLALHSLADFNRMSLNQQATAQIHEGLRWSQLQIAMGPLALSDVFLHRLSRSLATADVRHPDVRSYLAFFDGMDGPQIRSAVRGRSALGPVGTFFLPWLGLEGWPRIDAPKLVTMLSWAEAAPRRGSLDSLAETDRPGSALEGGIDRAMELLGPNEADAFARLAQERAFRLFQTGEAPLRPTRAADRDLAAYRVVLSEGGRRRVHLSACACVDRASQLADLAPWLLQQPKLRAVLGERIEGKACFIWYGSRSEDPGAINSYSWWQGVPGLTGLAPGERELTTNPGESFSTGGRWTMRIRPSTRTGPYGFQRCDVSARRVVAGDRQ